MNKTFTSEATTIRVSKEVTQQLRKLRQKQNLPSMSDALMIWIDKKAQKKAQEILEKAKVIDLVDKVGYAAYLSQLSQVIGRVLCKKYPELIKKSRPEIEKEIEQVFAGFPQPIRQSIRRYAEKEGWLLK